MSDDEGFLARWSRRKRGAGPPAGDDAKPADAAERAAPPLAVDTPTQAEAETPVDPASLPPIESIGPDSDIRAFLRAGVPADLTRAALRRAWSSDPVIRDFIGLSENAWDFNAPDSIGGFGAVTADEARRLLARMTEAPATADPAPPAGQTASSEPAAPGPGQEQPRKDDDQGTDDHASPQRDKEDAAMQHNSGEHEYTPILPRRGHGGALPE